MGVNRFDVFSTGGATATDLRLDGARRQLGSNVTVNQFGGKILSLSATSLVNLSSSSSLQFWTGSKASVQITSSNALDTANVMYIEGIDGVAGGTIVSETIQLNGTTAVPLLNSYAWVNVCQQYQSTNANKGKVQLETSAGIERFAILADVGNLMSGGIAIPKGHSAVVTNLTISLYSATAGVSEIVLLWMNDGLVQTQLYSIQVSHGLSQTTINVPTTFISDWNNGQPTVDGGLFVLMGKNISGDSAVISWSGNCLITKVDKSK
tara:strand:- start:1250 stop:2044 length:795 start_codon:yes stop_codon:yes gene_type:complete